MNTQGNTGAGAAGQEDYGDKGTFCSHNLSCERRLTRHTGLDAIEKKVGQSTGHTMDPNKMRSTNEKVWTLWLCHQTCKG